MATTKKRPGRCWACGESHLAVGDPPEHIGGSALGSTLTTDRFAWDCNRELGRRVDQPFMRDFLVSVSRARHGIRDPRRSHRPPPNPRHQARTVEGQRVVFDWRDGGITVPPHVFEDEGRVIVSAETEQEARRVAERKISRLRRKGQEFEPGMVVRRTNAQEPEEARMTLSLSSTIRAKVAAKIALATFSLVLPEDWLDTATAKLLQSWLWDEAPRTSDGEKIVAIPRKVPEPMDKFCRPPEHALFFLPSTKAHANLGIALFGEEFMVVGTGPLAHPPPEKAWLLDPIAHTHRATTFSELVMRARYAYAEEFARVSKRDTGGDSGPRRTDRPR
jgi:hypothetical protein